MPVVIVKMVAGRTDEQRKRIIAGITKVIVETLSVEPSGVTVILDDVSKESWGEEGKPLAKS